MANCAMFSNDIFIEVGHGPTLIDNNILLSKVNVIMPSEARKESIEMCRELDEQWRQV